MPIFGSLHSWLAQRRNPSDGWQEVPQFDEFGLHHDDELMRMAAEADGSDNYIPDDLTTDHHDGTDHDVGNPVFSSRYNFLQWRIPHRRTGMQRLCKVICECGIPKTGENPTLWLFILSIMVLLVMCAVSSGLGVYSVLKKKPEPVIDKSIQAFSIPNHKAYIHIDALMLARKNNASRFRFKRDVSNTDSLSAGFRSDSRETTGLESSSRVKRSGNFEVQKYPYQIIKRWKMQVIYLAKGDEEHNIFTEERLRMVHKVESDIISHPRFKEFCLRDPQVASFDPAVRDLNGCAPLNSLLSYFFPSQDANGNIFYDGYGKNLDDIESALHLAMNHDSFYYFVDEKINKTYQKSRLMRTEVLFGAPLPGFQSLGDHREVQTDRFKEFVITYIDLLSKASTDKVHVLYGGNELFDYEVESTFWADVRMAVYACIAITLFMFVLTSFSFYLTFMGILCIVLSFPLAFFFYRVVFNILALGILNGAAAFVIIGIGVDDVFVFINIFRQTSHMKSVNGRLLYTVKTAGVATFFTSFTTSVAFAANIASSIPAVYEFGLFMSLIVASCWVNVFLLMPPILYIYAFWFEPLEQMCGNICCHCVQKQDASVPLDAEQVESPDSGANMTISSDEDDVPLIQMDNEVNPSTAPASGGDDDVPMLVPPPTDIAPVSLNAIESVSSSSIGRVQQYALGVFVEKFVIRFRIPIILFFGMILLGSVICMTQLTPSDHPPQLFEPDTNLQRLLDLKANFSIIDTLHCDRCSALYNVKAEDTSSPPSHPPTPPTIRTPQPPPTPQPTPQPQPTIPPTQPQPWTRRPLPPTTHAPESVPAETRRPERPLPTTPAPRLQPWTPPPPPTEKIQDITPKSSADQPAKSVENGYDVCKRQSCAHLKDRPIMQSGATVYVVFGIKGINRDSVEAGHVLSEYRGDVMFDEQFANEVGDLRNLSQNKEHIRELCQVCHLLASNTELVKNGSAQCLPNNLPPFLDGYLKSITECQNLPKSLTIYQHEAPAHAEASISQEGKLIWLAFAFESTTSPGQSYFEAYKNYLKWEKFLQHIIDNKLSKNSPLKSMFQTSEFWTKVLMEVVAVNSAIYSLVLSLVVCVCAVAIFTGHLVLLLIIFVTIVAMICLVVGVFYIAGWQMGAVEAVSLSILVGSSVDYCMHLVEGYLVVGKQIPETALLSNNQARQWRTTSAIRHIGSSIISSALTTIMAAIPLTQTTIQPFAKFGAIVLINTSVSIVFTLTLCVALLTTFAPARFINTWKSHVLAFVITAAVCGAVLLVMYIITTKGVFIPGPNGEPLFG